MRIGGVELRWGSRTHVMGIVNVTPDSFSGDGLLRAGIQGVLDHCRGMVAEGADLLDLGGESTRPGHTPVDTATERWQSWLASGACHTS